MLAIKRVSLKQMPFAVFTANHEWINPTGYEVQLEDGSWAIEYEGLEYKDAPNCIYESEWDYVDAEWYTFN